MSTDSGNVFIIYINIDSPRRPPHYHIRVIPKSSNLRQISITCAVMPRETDIDISSPPSIEVTKTSCSLRGVEEGWCGQFRQFWLSKREKRRFPIRLYR